jgi:acetyl esterase/lipase
MLRNVSDPSLTVFTPAPAKANGVGVIVCPGGVWRVLAWEHEGINPARWLAARGHTVFLLKYRVRGTPPDPAEYAEIVAKRFAGIPAVIPGAKAPRALADGLPDESIPRAREIAADDGRRAIEIVRERAVEWGVKPDRIGMVGFSAGAFLAIDVAMDPRGAPLAFIAPIYGGETQAAPYQLTHRPCSQRSPRTTGCFSEWSRAFMPTGPAPIARQSCTSSPVAATALASPSAGCPWTAGPIC